jgi:hypothetical protein
MVALMMLAGGSCSARDETGTWKMNEARSQLDWTHPRSITVRIEPHAKGEVFTYERVSGNGQAVTFSVILYLDGRPREWQGSNCSGTLLSRRLNGRTVEIIGDCNNGPHFRFVRTLDPNGHDLFLDQKETQPSHRGLERHLILERQK